MMLLQAQAMHARPSSIPDQALATAQSSRNLYKSTFCLRSPCASSMITFSRQRERPPQGHDCFQEVIKTERADLLVTEPRRRPVLKHSDGERDSITSAMNITFSAAALKKPSQRRLGRHSMVDKRREPSHIPLVGSAQPQLFTSLHAPLILCIL